MTVTIPEDLEEAADQVEELSITLEVSRRMSPRTQTRLIADVSLYLHQLSKYLHNLAVKEKSGS